MAIKRFAKKKKLKSKFQEIRQGLPASPNYKRLNSELSKKLAPKDVLVINEISVLGPSFSTVIGIIAKLIEKDVEILSVKEPLELHPRVLKSRSFLHTLEFTKLVEQFIVTQRANRSLIKRKASGKPLGRPKGSKSKTTKLSNRKDTVLELLKDGISYSAIGRIMKVHRLTVRSFVKSNQMNAHKS